MCTTTNMMIIIDNFAWIGANTGPAQEDLRMARRDLLEVDREKVHYVEIYNARMPRCD